MVMPLNAGSENGSTSSNRALRGCSTTKSTMISIVARAISVWFAVEVRDGRGKRLVYLVGNACEHADDQLVAAVEAFVEVACRQFGSAAERTDRDSGGAFLADDVEGGVHERRSAEGLSLDERGSRPRPRGTAAVRRFRTGHAGLLPVLLRAPALCLCSSHFICARRRSSPMRNSE